MALLPSTSVVSPFAPSFDKNRFNVTQKLALIIGRPIREQFSHFIHSAQRTLSARARARAFNAKSDSMPFALFDTILTKGKCSQFCVAARRLHLRRDSRRSIFPLSVLLCGAHFIVAHRNRIARSVSAEFQCHSLVSARKHMFLQWPRFVCRAQFRSPSIKNSLVFRFFLRKVDSV